MNVFVDMYDEITPAALKANRLLAESIDSYEFTCLDCPNSMRFLDSIAKCRICHVTLNTEQAVFNKSQCPYYNMETPFVIVAFRGGKREILDTLYAGTLSELIDMFYTSGMFFVDEKPTVPMDSIFDLVNYCNKYTQSDTNFSFYPLRDKSFINKINLYFDLLSGNSTLDDHLVKYVLGLIRNDIGTLLKYFEKYEAVYDAADEDKE